MFNDGAAAVINATAAEKYSGLSLTRTPMDRVRKIERKGQLASILDSLEDPLSRVSLMTRKSSSAGVDTFPGEVISNTLRDGRKRTVSATEQTYAEQARRKAMRLDPIPPKRKSYQDGELSIGENPLYNAHRKKRERGKGQKSLQRNYPSSLETEND